MVTIRNIIFFLDLVKLHGLQSPAFPHGLPYRSQPLGRNILLKPEVVVKVMISTDTADNTIQRYRSDPAISGVEGRFFFLLGLEAFYLWRAVILPAAIDYLKKPSNNHQLQNNPGIVNTLLGTEGGIFGTSFEKILKSPRRSGKRWVSLWWA